jgi:hypothetical protein
VAAAACFLVVSTALYLRQASHTSPNVSQPVGESAHDTTNGRNAATAAAGKIMESEPTGTGELNVLEAFATSPSRPAVHRQRAPSRQLREVASRLEGRAAGPQRNTVDFSVEQAPVIVGRGVPFALKTPDEPMRLVLRDERGAGRVVPMRAVSFGAQELIARENASRQLTAADNEGVW